MSEKYILSIDQGTTSCRAIIFDLKGVKIATSQKEITQYFPKEGWVEHDPIEILERQISVIKDVVKRAKIDSENIKAIGITNQRETTVVWDKTTGKPIHNAIVWQDRRTAKFCDHLISKNLTETIRNKTGLIIDAYFSGTKIKYILDSVDGARKAAITGNLAFGTIDTWLIWNLTKQKNHKTDVTNASRTMLFNIHNLDWDKEMVEILDVPENILPEVISCDGFFGDLDPDIAGFTAPICGVAGDQQAALFGQLCIKAGMAKNTYGTGCFVMLNTGENILKSSNKLLSTVAWKINDKVNYAIEGSVFIGGAVIQWLRDGLEIITSAKESESLALSVPDNGGVIFVPALSGLGAPHWDQYARGAILGITRATTKAHIARAAIESIALQVKDLVNSIQNDLGYEIKELRVDGGASANELLMQIQANFLQKTVIRPIELETTALGVAYIAGLGAGLYEDIDAIKEIWQVDTIYTHKPLKPIDVMTLEYWEKGISRSKNWIIK